MMVMIMMMMTMMMIMMVMMVIVGCLPYPPLAIDNEPNTSDGIPGPKKKVVVKTIL